MRYSLRSLLVVLTVVGLTFGLGQALGLTWCQAVLVGVPVGFFTASLFTLYYIARQGSEGNRNTQLILILVIEFLMVPIASTAAIVAYFL